MSLKPSDRMKIKSLLVAAACSAVSILANPYADLQLPNQLLTAGTANNAYEGLFDLVHTGNQSVSGFGYSYSDIPGFNPATMDAIDGHVEFLLYTPSTGTRQFSIDLGDLNLVTGGAFDYFQWEVDDVTADLLVGISDTGTLAYKVTATAGSFTLGGAYLEVDAAPGTSVPDGGSVSMLLGLSFLGLAGFKKLVR